MGPGGRTVALQRAAKVLRSESFHGSLLAPRTLRVEHIRVHTLCPWEALCTGVAMKGYSGLSTAGSVSSIGVDTEGTSLGQSVLRSLVAFHYQLHCCCCRVLRSVGTHGPRARGCRGSEAVECSRTGREQGRTSTSGFPTHDAFFAHARTEKYDDVDYYCCCYCYHHCFCYL